MSTHDKNGRPWAKLSELKSGDRLQAATGFDCILDGQVVEVYRLNEDLYVPCSHGNHNLSGQIAEDGETIVGFYLVEA